jgi:hypothetical protein
VLSVEGSTEGKERNEERLNRSGCGHGGVKDLVNASGSCETKSCLDSAEANLRSFREVVFPNADDAPTGFSEHPIHLAIPRLIRDEFLFPKGAIVGRDVGVFRTGVPETAVHENGQPRFPEDEVRFSIGKC